MFRPEASGVLEFDFSNSASLECDFARTRDTQKTVCMDCYDLNKVVEDLRGIQSLKKHRKTISLAKIMRCSHEVWLFSSFHQAQ